MGRRSMTGGVVGKGGQRIQYEFRLNGVRYRPTIEAIPTEANLAHCESRRAKNAGGNLPIAWASGTAARMSLVTRPLAGI